MPLEAATSPKILTTSAIASIIFRGGLKHLAAAWRERAADEDVRRAAEILSQKFASPEDFGPGQVVEFFDSQEAEARAMQARRAFELVQGLLKLLSL